MTIRSFAQNFEDVLLWRALKHVTHGRYVDVGAGHPEHHSVTKLFYDAGWSGVNIEPLPALAEALAKQRPRDINLQAAVSTTKGKFIELTVVENWDELSTVSPSRVEELGSEGRTLTTVKVPAVRLDETLREHGLGDIQFLKVDVEGAELDVLQTIDLETTRPWIIVVEVLSGSAKSSPRNAIREYLVGHAYSHAYHDGLNDFYIADEHVKELLPSFETPVNVTDNFVVVSDSDRVMVDFIGEKVGMPYPADASEVVQRIEALIRDRIRFESEAREVEEQRIAAAVEFAAERELLEEQRIAAAVEFEAEREGLVERLEKQRIAAAVEFAAEREGLEEQRIVTAVEFAAERELLVERLESAQHKATKATRTLKTSRLTAEAMEQSSFERERLIAWYAKELSNFRARLWYQEKIAAEAAAKKRARHAQTRVAEVLASIFWRLTLPLRVIRRPRFYLRLLRNR